MGATNGLLFLFHFLVFAQIAILNFFQVFCLSLLRKKSINSEVSVYNSLWQTPFVRILAWENLQFHKKWSTNHFEYYWPLYNVVSIQTFITKILKSWKRKNHVFSQMFCLLFLSAHCNGQTQSASWVETKQLQ